MRGSTAADEAAHELYGVPFADFVARRNELARHSGAESAAVRALPKPSASAWVVDLLVRDDPTAIEALVSVGDELRDIQSTGDRVALAAVSSDRRRIVSELAERGIELGAAHGHRVSGTAATEVADTLQAVVADRDAAAAAQTGRLVRALRTTGFEAVDLAGAVAGAPPTSLGAPGGPDPGHQGRGQRQAQGQGSRGQESPVLGSRADGDEGEPANPLAPRRLSRADRADRDHEEAIAAAEEALTHAEEAATAIAELQGDAEALSRRRDDLESELEELADRTAEVEEDLRAVDRDIRSLRSARERAERSAAAAKRNAERAHLRLRELEAD